MEPNHNAKIYTLKTNIHESARVDGYADGWTANRVSPRVETEAARDIEARARDLVRNSSIARTIIDVQVNAITQPTPALVLQPITLTDQSETRAKVANDYIYDAFESTGIDFERMRSPAELFSAIVEEAAIGGGTIGVRIWDKTAKLGFRVKIFEQSYLARDMTKKVKSGGWIIEGKEYDSGDRLIAYHIYDTYADDPLFKKRSTVRYDEKDVFHYFVPPRPGAVIGLSWLSPVVADIRLLEDIKYSSQLRSRNSQSITAFVTQPPEMSLRTNPTDGAEEGQEAAVDVDDRGFAKTTRGPRELKRSMDADAYSNRLAELRPGSFYILKAGEQIDFADPPAPIDFQSIYRPILSSMARAEGMSYEALSGDYSNSSYSAARMAENQHRSWTQRRRLSFKDIVLERLWLWIDGGLSLKGISTDGLWHRWQQPDQTSAHPKEDAEIMSLLVENGVSTVSEWIRKRGGDPDQVFEERARELKRMKDLGITSQSKNAEKRGDNDDKPVAADGVSKGKRKK